MRNPAVAKASTNKTPCCSKVGIKRGPWTPEEDELLANYIRKEGEGRWRTMPKRAGLLRCGKSCRLRWMNYLRPSVKRGQIAPDEEDLILRLHRLLGNRWSLIAGRIPGRTDNEIKNYWNTHLSKKLISQGIDPRTHKPLNPSPPPTTTTPTTSSQTPHDPAASTSHPNKNPNPNPNISGLEDRFITIKSCQNLRLTNLDSDEYQNRVLIHNQRTENWQNSDGLMMGNLQSCNHGINNNSNKEDDMGYCNEDMFSSFLNSLINEDVFVNQQPQRQPQPEQPNLIAPVISSHTGVSSVKRLNNGSAAVWEDGLTSTVSDGLGHEQNCLGSSYHTT